MSLNIASIGSQPVVLSQEKQSRVQSYFETVRNVCTSMQTALNDSPEFHRYRSIAFGKIEEIYTEVNLQAVALLNNDRCLSQAEKVIRGQVFSDFPGCVNRLIPKAESYIRSFETLSNALSCGNSELSLLINSTQSLVEQHRNFFRGFADEATIARRNEVPIVKVIDQDTIALFVDAFLKYLSTVPEDTYSQIAQRVAERDSEFFFLIPRLAIERLLQRINVPLFFESATEQLTELKGKYAQLTSEDKELLYENLIKNEVNIPEGLKVLTAQIRNLAINVERNGQARLGTAVFNACFSDLDQALFLIEQIKRTACFLHVAVSNCDQIQIDPYERLLFALITAPNSEAPFSLDDLRKKYLALNDQEKDQFLKVWLYGEKLVPISKFYREFIRCAEKLPDQLKFSCTGQVVKFCSKY